MTKYLMRPGLNLYWGLLRNLHSTPHHSVLFQPQLKAELDGGLGPGSRCCAEALGRPLHVILSPLIEQAGHSVPTRHLLTFPGTLSV